MKKGVVVLLALGATIAFATPVLAQVPNPPGRGGGPGGGGGRMDFAARRAQMEKMRTGIYEHLGLNSKQKKALAHLDKHIGDEQTKMFAGMMRGGPGGPGGPPGRPGAGGPPGMRPGGGGPPGMRPGGGGPPGGGFGAMREKMQAVQKERETGMQKILTKDQYAKYTAEWEKIRPRRRGGPGGGGGRPGGARAL